MKFLFPSLLAAAIAIGAGGLCNAATMEIHGVKVEETALLAGTKLQLNGAGTRYRGPFKVYVAELYTTKKVSTFEELVAAPGPKRMSLTMLREVEADKFGKLLTRGVEDNLSKNELSKIIPGLIRMSEIFIANKVLVPGDVILMDWVPGVGMTTSVKGKQQGEPFKEPEFFNALMSIWFGKSPADWRLRDAMLGEKS